MTPETAAPHVLIVGSGFVDNAISQSGRPEEGNGKG